MITLIKGMNCEKLYEASIVYARCSPFLLLVWIPTLRTLFRATSIVRLILTNDLKHDIRPNFECFYKQIANYSEENIKKKKQKYLRKFYIFVF